VGDAGDGGRQAGEARGVSWQRRDKQTSGQTNQQLRWANKLANSDSQTNKNPTPLCPPHWHLLGMPNPDPETEAINALDRLFLDSGVQGGKSWPPFLCDPLSLTHHQWKMFSTSSRLALSPSSQTKVSDFQGWRLLFLL